MLQLRPTILRAVTNSFVINHLTKFRSHDSALAIQGKHGAIAKKRTKMPPDFRFVEGPFYNAGLLRLASFSSASANRSFGDVA